MPGSLSSLWQRLTQLFTRAPRDHRDHRQLALPDGTPILIRPLIPEDAPAVEEALRHLSETTRYRRFLAPVERLSEAQLRYLTCVDGVDHIALGMAVIRGGRLPPEPIAIARSIRDRLDPEVAEVAIVVADEWQHRGVGTLLLGHLGDRAWAAGVRRWRAVMLAENGAVSGLLDKVAARLSHVQDGPTVEVLYALKPAPALAPAPEGERGSGPDEVRPADHPKRDQGP